jgi:hypothetical protein
MFGRKELSPCIFEIDNMCPKKEIMTMFSLSDGGVEL